MPNCASTWRGQVETPCEYVLLFLPFIPDGVSRTDTSTLLVLPDRIDLEQRRTVKPIHGHQASLWRVVLSHHHRRSNFFSLVSPSLSNQAAPA